MTYFFLWNQQFEESSIASHQCYPPDFISGRKFQLIYNQIWNLHCSHSLHIDALSKAPSNAIIRMHGMLEVLKYIFLQIQEILLVLKWFCFVIFPYFYKLWSLSKLPISFLKLLMKWRKSIWNFKSSVGKNIFGVEILFPPPTK